MENLENIQKTLPMGLPPKKYSKTDAISDWPEKNTNNMQKILENI